MAKYKNELPQFRAIRPEEACDKRERGGGIKGAQTLFAINNLCARGGPALPPLDHVPESDDQHRELQRPEYAECDIYLGVSGRPSSGNKLFQPNKQLIPSPTDHIHNKTRYDF